MNTPPRRPWIDHVGDALPWRLLPIALALALAEWTLPGAAGAAATLLALLAVARLVVAIRHGHLAWRSERQAAHA